MKKWTVLFLGLVNASFAVQAGVSWSAGTVEFNVAKIENATVTYTYKVDAAYAKKYQVAVPAPFEIQVPKVDNVYVRDVLAIVFLVSSSFRPDQTIDEASPRKRSLGLGTLCNLV